MIVRRRESCGACIQSSSTAGQAIGGVVSLTKRACQECGRDDADGAVWAWPAAWLAARLADSRERRQAALVKADESVIGG